MSDLATQLPSFGFTDGSLHSLRRPGGAEGQHRETPSASDGLGVRSGGAGGWRGGAHFYKVGWARKEVTDFREGGGVPACL